MMQLGTDKQGSEMRARLMSASLLSDMESFKVSSLSIKLIPGIIYRNYTDLFNLNDNFIMSDIKLSRKCKSIRW